ncbi:hypothetical protein IMG5_060990 [Ichthyophthirius multifiliis]|uniref:Transmembrane protein n=1 Tax=Ichthyophthirius multifiliis TaxID=5932 RepID=G0QNR8_ICHMU|nr:hypothetical protein IMG5_060990 [Ichthyophthirius multifiliis]EGR33148.1 hypothetical protein IMG5_060990 [Ichthyophthirius multifiliis]|eukprot:XP_004037134.1 hypothetical protein IMG5_060990 [Ichthyophthirius multifiliis]
MEKVKQKPKYLQYQVQRILIKIKLTKQKRLRRKQIKNSNSQLQLNFKYNKVVKVFNLKIKNHQMKFQNMRISKKIKFQKILVILIVLQDLRDLKKINSQEREALILIKYRTVKKQTESWNKRKILQKKKKKLFQKKSLNFISRIVLQMKTIEVYQNRHFKTKNMMKLNFYLKMNIYNQLIIAFLNLKMIV